MGRIPRSPSGSSGSFPGSMARKTNSVLELRRGLLLPANTGGRGAVVTAVEEDGRHGPAVLGLVAIDAHRLPNPALPAAFAMVLEVLIFIAAWTSRCLWELVDEMDAG